MSNKTDALSPSFVIAWAAFFIQGDETAFFVAFVIAYASIVAILVTLAALSKPGRATTPSSVGGDPDWVATAAE